MPDWSRRHTLHVVATAGAALAAGCGGPSSDRREELPPPRERVTDFETLLARNTRGEALVVQGSTPTPAETPSTEERRQEAALMEHLTSDDDVEEIRFRTAAGAADLQSFVTRTDFASASVYLLQRPIEECYRPRLIGVYREGDGVDAEFCSDLRPADVDCDASARDMIAVAIRLPFAGDDFNSVGSGWGGDCEHVATVELNRSESR